MSTSVQQPSPVNPRSRRWRWAAAIAAVVIVVAGIVTAVLVRADRTEQGSPHPAPGTSASAAPPASVSPSTPAGGSPGGTTPATPASPGQPVPGFAFQPLWPFTGSADAAAWQESYRTGGHQPWHLDAALTAQSFTQGYLGYTELDLVTGTTTQGTQAWVGVGYRAPNGAPATAAVVHLAKLGSGTDAPWEVVGTRDSTLTLTQPRYGATVTSPVTVGGRITGVDENLAAQIREPGGGVAGQAAGVPAGGQNTPWSVPVSFTASPGTVLTIAVATGGHVAAVERFAVTGVVAGH